MFFLLPLAHERGEARRWPIIAIVLCLLCFLITFLTEVTGADLSREAENRLRDVAAFEDEHPWVPGCDVGARAGAGAARIPEDVSEADLGRQKAELADLCASAHVALERLPAFKWGDVPGRGGVLGLFTYQFLHSGWLHLFFNLWFLWLTAVNLEDRWGRPVFLAFYLLAGVAGGVAHRLSAPGSMAPLVGASGAVAGAMGAFLVVFATTRIRFLYVYIITFKPKWGTFDAPAYVMLPLWLIVELLSGVLLPADGTAHWAHVGGFVFGAIVAGVMRLTGIDAKLDASLETAATVSQDARILEASGLIDAGRAADAAALLAGLADAQPAAVDPRLELLRATSVTGDEALRAKTMAELVAIYADLGESAPAMDLLLELKKNGLYRSAPRPLLAQLGERLARKGQPMLAGQAFAMVHGEGLTDAIAVQAAIGHATLLLKLGHVADAEELLGRAKESPFSTMELDSKIDAQLAMAGRAKG
ncbi:MAG TPA: rhomboid family intramembrane serine protease [Polyangiaceae bacterium]|nr:rhomboid family intramembrane serine protease [Polyangiaceae bacterium]